MAEAWRGGYGRVCVSGRGGGVTLEEAHHVGPVLHVHPEQLPHRVPSAAPPVPTLTLASSVPYTRTRI